MPVLMTVDDSPKGREEALQELIAYFTADVLDKNPGNYIDYDGMLDGDRLADEVWMKLDGYIDLSKAELEAPRLFAKIKQAAKEDAEAARDPLGNVGMDQGDFLAAG